MQKHEMFLAMVLTNAKREEARAVVLELSGDRPRMELLLLDGSSRSLIPPPPEILIAMVESLENGQRQFQSSVYAIDVETVTVQRGPDSVMARIDSWTMEHV